MVNDRARAWVALAATIVVVATGCGSGPGSKGASGSVPSTPRSTFAADKLRADSLLLTTGDLPVGWIKLAVFDTTAHVRADARALERDRALSCLRSAFTALAKSLAYDHPGVTVHGVQAKRLNDPTDRNVTVAYRVSLTLAASGESPILLYVDDFKIGSQRDALSVVVDSQGTPPNASLERTLLSKIDAKLRKAYA